MADAPDLFTETFDGLVGTPTYPNNYPNGGTGYYNTNSTGITFGLVRYVGSGSFGFETYILGPDVASGQYSINGSFALTGGRTLSDVYLPTGVTAFGADFGAVGAATGNLTLTVYLGDGSTESTTLPVATRSQFFGYYDVRGITRINLNSNGVGFYPYTLLDNVSIGGPAVVTPEPSALGLATLGILSMLSSSRSRTRRGCTQ